MATQRAIGGYAIRAELTSARNASREARQFLQRLIEDRPGPQTQAMLVASLAIRLGTIEQVLGEIDKIARQASK